VPQKSHQLLVASSEIGRNPCFTGNGRIDERRWFHAALDNKVNSTMITSQTLRAWLKASRPPSQLYICIPLIAGQLYARSAGHALNAWICFWVQFFGICIQLYIVYANDYADVAADLINRTYTAYSGGSRVLVDCAICRSALGRAAIAAALVAVGTGLVLGSVWGRWFTVALALLSILLLHLYSYSPARLNYRGGGEILQMVGTGVVLPFFGWYAQAGTTVGFPVLYLAAILPTMLACAITTSLPDEISDRESRKRSASVLLGQRPAQTMVIALHTASIVFLFLVSRARADGAVSSLGLVALLAIVAQLLLFGGSPGSSRLLWFGASSIVATLLITLASAVFPPAPRYNFLMLCLLLAVPAAMVYSLRPDLRSAMARTALAALPLAFTESLFLGVYWSPIFLFDLGSRYGFGIEDFLFVALLGMLTCASYPTAFRKGLRPAVKKRSRVACMLPLALGGAGLAVVLLLPAIPIIYRTWSVMGLFVLVTWIVRGELIGPSCAGGAIVTVCYWLICLGWQILYPGIFTSAWNQEALSGLFVFGVPIEELIYAGMAGMSGTVLYPLLAHREFVQR